MNKNGIRLNKYIASTSFCSRRKADELIEKGCVKVNGKIITEFGFTVTSKDLVTINGIELKQKELTYIKYYKPAGYITTMSDEKGRKTIYDILPDEVRCLKPVGRLDKDSTGLLILTNDGDLINELAHPSIRVPKVYRVSVDGKVTKNDILQMEKGLEIEKGKIAYAQVTILEISSKSTVMEIVLTQGLNRQIRKMFDMLGHQVISLKRLSIANINITGLKKGAFQYLKPKQIKELKNYLTKLKKLAED